MTYDDRTFYSSRATRWADLPADGFQECMCYEDWRDAEGKRKRFILSGYDWYFSDGDQLFGGNNDTKTSIMTRYNLAENMVKQGKWVSGIIWEPLSRDLWTRSGSEF